MSYVIVFDVIDQLHKRSANSWKKPAQNLLYLLWIDLPLFISVPYGIISY